MTAAWPIELPQSLSGDGDYKESPPKIVVRSQTDSGIIKTRRRQTAAESTIEGSIQVTGAGVDTFLSFLNNTIAGGASFFSGNLSRSGASQIYRFTEDPQISHLGGDHYRIAIKLNVLP